MRCITRAVLLASLCAIMIQSANADKVKNERYTIGLWGDIPYVDDPPPAIKDNAEMQKLAASMNSYKLEFSVFVGDTKSGSSVCDNNKIQLVKDLFKLQQAPVVYAIGDNEWTDCHRTGGEPLTILQQLRTELFPDPSQAALARKSLSVQPQRVFTSATTGSSADFVENVRFVRGPAMFVVLHMPGSNNNKVNACGTRPALQCEAANNEYALRNEANSKFIIDSFNMAKQQGLKGVMIIAQANPTFDIVLTEGANESVRTPSNDGYTLFLDTLYLQTKGFYGQVVYVHGDTHQFVLDRPLPITSATFAGGDVNAYGVKQGKTLPNFTRLMTFGDRNDNAWVLCTVDESRQSLFAFEPVVVY